MWQCFHIQAPLEIENPSVQTQSSCAESASVSLDLKELYKYVVIIIIIIFFHPR